MRYSEMNDGQLDDGTSYSDDVFIDSYFPEVAEIRDSIVVSSNSSTSSGCGYSSDCAVVALYMMPY
jgi:hypothetical protein